MAQPKVKMKMPPVAEFESALWLCELTAPQPCQRAVLDIAGERLCGAPTTYALVATSTPTLKSKERIIIPLCKNHFPRWLRKHLPKKNT